MLKSLSTLALILYAFSSFAQPQLKIDSVTVTGQYDHYDHQTGDQFNVTVYDWAGSHQKKYSAPIDPSGKFTIKFPFPVAGDIYLDWGRIYEANVAFPGETIRLYADLAEYKGTKAPVSTRFEGANANVHTDYMRYYYDVMRTAGDSLYSLRNRLSSGLEYRDSAVTVLQRKLRKLDDYARKQNLDKRSVQIIQAYLRFSTAGAMTQFIYKLTGSSSEISPAYLSSIDSIHMMAQSAEFFPGDYMMALRDKKNYAYTLANKAKTKEIDSVWYSLLKNDFEKELAYTWTTNQHLAASNSLGNNELQAFEDKVKDPYLRSEINARNNELLKLAQNDALLKNTRLITTIPELATAEELMAHIASQFKGKVVYMDIWGTWCAPCRDQMQYSPALKQRLKGKDVVFVYLANNSPETAWKTAIKQLMITGDNVVHYNLPKAQQSMIEKKYLYRGFPTYILIDKEGKFITNQAPRPSDPDAVEKAVAGLL
ncbi:TlpA family protein disulfide reductase [Chitinophaga sp. GCM10012297]|uniref:TlpA family protein disulfide reductase n=1 Tax=Chitinophaga chungangae TaxID=2821488 RepID=A0ABS3Y8D2_9BACT|nr:TlpA disulfide reductase family protein [Chitinophaga chungangae]MBO9150928.1 TlpA family protein disulfide reductase [Chitinophaga chungangae]